jgi:excisionase family DNA binding protein
MSPEDLATAKRIHEGMVSVAEILRYLQTDCFLTKASAAKFIDHEERKIEEAIRRGHLRAYKIGKKVLLRKSDLEAWIQSGEITRENHEADRTDLQRLTDRALEQARQNVKARKAAE